MSDKTLDLLAPKHKLDLRGFKKHQKFSDLPVSIDICKRTGTINLDHVNGDVIDYTIDTQKNTNYHTMRDGKLAGWLTVNSKEAYVRILQPYESPTILVGMRYTDYKDSYKLLLGPHAYTLLSYDNNGIPEFRTEPTNEYDKTAVYLGTPDKKYAYIVKHSEYASSELIRSILYDNDKLVKSICYRLDTDKAVYKGMQSVIAYTSTYIMHPLFKPEVEYGLSIKPKEGSDLVCKPAPRDMIYDGPTKPYKAVRKAVMSAREYRWQDFDEDDDDW